MLVRMKIKISGTRDGADWPAKGDTIDVPDDEAAALVASVSAEVVEPEPEPEPEPELFDPPAVSKK
ncbi:MAG: hypothetical protein ACKV2O_14695 [Acidimicrobiales bacterium]